MRFLCAAALLATGGLTFLFAQGDKNFTGGEVTKLDSGAAPAIAHFRFGPGSRTKWHSHSGGQIILVEEGVALTQVKGGPVIELHAGETTYVGPGVMHWHGGGVKEGGVQYNVTRGDITWGAEVTDAEYKAKPKRP